MKEYNVILKKDIDYDGFWEDMETETDGLLYIPNRRINYTNERVGSLRQCWYLLTDEEVETLRQDSRVLGVEIPPEHRDDIIITPNATQDGVFTKTSSSTGTFHNWGLIRCLSKENNYGTNTTTSLKYTHTLTGRGVDVVIQDSGIQIDHPEFQDENGVTRFESVNWGSYSGGAFVQSGNHDRDFDGHGTHVAGTLAGKTFGWARRARIHHQKITGLEGSGDAETGILPSYAFDSIKSWHNSKSVDPNTGYKRPTVVNMSWGYLSTYTSVSSINYRGTSYTGVDIDTTTKRNNNYGLITNLFNNTPTYSANVRITSIDTDIEEMIDAGIVVCVAAGNRSNKVDVSGGDDYDNYVVTNSTTVYYHRGSSPFHPTALIVGNMDSSVHNASTDRKATSSETGPGVTIYAPGTNIISACSNTNRFSAPAYYGNTSFKQVNISGTSMASPQVAGVAALILELHPEWSPAQVKAWLLDKAGTVLLNTITTFTTTAPGSANYLINGSSNPTLTLIVGQTYTFNLNVSGHPFYIKTNQSTGTGNAYNTGVTNNGASTGTLTFTVPVGAPATLYYNCQFHSLMRGTINIVSTINNDWTNTRSLKGGSAKVLHNPFTNPNPVTINNLSGTFNIKIKPR